jgi:hypothetical protein
MEVTRVAYFDPAKIAIFRGVLDDAWSRLPTGLTDLSRSLLAERI